MAFSLTSTNIYLDSDGCTLHADCQHANDASRSPSSLSLQPIIGNHDGKFVWGYSNYHLTARNIKLDQHILSAELQTADRLQWKPATLDLDTNIRNIDGKLQLVSFSK